MINKIANIGVGSASVGAIEVVQNVDVPQSANHEETLKVILQLIITIATLVGLFKKKATTTT